MSETEREGRRIDEEFYGNPYAEKKPQKPSMAKRFYDDVRNDWSKMAGHVRKAESKE